MEKTKLPGLKTSFQLRLTSLIIAIFSGLIFTSALAQTAPVRVYTFDSQGNPIAGVFKVWKGPNYQGQWNSGDTAYLNIGDQYKIVTIYQKTTATPAMLTVSPGGDSLGYKTTNVKFHFSGDYLAYRGSGDWNSFGLDSLGNWQARELFPFDFYGDTMRIHTGYVWNDPRGLDFDIYYQGQTSIEKTLSVLYVRDSKGDPIQGATGRGGYATPSVWHVPGSTNANGLLLDMRDGKQSNLSYEAKVNNTTAVEGPKDPTQDSYYLFNTDSLELILQTCQGEGLYGGSVRYGNGANYGTWWFPGNPTDSNGRIVGEVFPGTYSFEMQYKGTADQKISVAIPAGGSSLVWNTVKVMLQHDGDISYGGATGDSRFYSKPSMELLPGTYKFHFRQGNRQDLTLSGCYFSKRTAIVNVLDCNGNHQADVGVKWYKYGDAGNKIDADSTAGAPLAICIDSGISKIGVVVNYLGQSNTLVQHLDIESDSFTFQMVKVELALYNHDSTATLNPDTVKFYVYGQAANKMGFPNSQEKCLLPGKYGFVVDYNATSQTKNPVDVSQHNPVVFQTGLIDDVDTCTYDPTTYYQYGNAANPSPFIDPMELMPSKVIVKSSTNPNKTVNVQPGAIHRLDSCTNEEVTDSCVSDGSWMMSTVITPSNWSGYWAGVNSLPDYSSFTDSAPVGQPYSWGGITVLPGSLPIKAPNHITYYMKKFGLTDNVDVDARFQMYMDDGTEIYLNGHLLAREENMDKNNFKGVPHDLVMEHDQAPANGYMGGDAFDYVQTVDLDTILDKSMNYLVIVLRNPQNSSNFGGFSFRMDITKNGQSVLVKKAKPGELEGARLVAYPNPVNNLLTIEFDSPSQLIDHELSIFSMSGQLMFSQQFNTTDDIYQLDLSDLQHGIYYLRLLSGDKIRFVKIIKE